MRKRVYVSQRVDVNTDYQERRDALDQRWAELLWQAGYVAFPIFNNPDSLGEVLSSYPPNGILLSGGNSPVMYGGIAPERDAIDNLLIEYAIKSNTPLFGCCRGMQSIALYFGGSLRKVEGHAGVRHKINGSVCREVNSYHEFSIDIIAHPLIVTSRSSDNEI